MSKKTSSPTGSPFVINYYVPTDAPTPFNTSVPTSSPTAPEAAPFIYTGLIVGTVLVGGTFLILCVLYMYCLHIHKKPKHGMNDQRRPTQFESMNPLGLQQPYPHPHPHTHPHQHEQQHYGGNININSPPSHAKLASPYNAAL
jgi:hypothetical protein